MQFPTLSTKIKQNFEYDGSRQPDKLYICTSLIRDGTGTKIRPESTGICSSTLDPKRQGIRTAVVLANLKYNIENIDRFEARHTLKMLKHSVAVEYLTLQQPHIQKLLCLWITLAVTQVFSASVLHGPVPDSYLIFLYLIPDPHLSFIPVPALSLMAAQCYGLRYVLKWIGGKCEWSAIRGIFWVRHKFLPLAT